MVSTNKKFPFSVTKPTLRINGVDKKPKMINGQLEGTTFDAFAQIDYTGAGSGLNNTYFLTARGAEGSELKSQNGDSVATLFFGGWDGAAVSPTFSTGAVIDVLVDDVVDDGSVPCSMTFISSNLNSGTSSSFCLSSAGAIDVNTDKPVLIQDNASPAGNLVDIDTKKGVSVGTIDHTITVEGFTVDTKYNATQDNGSSISALQTYSATPLDTNTLAFLRARGTRDVPAAVAADDVIGQFIYAPKTTGANFNQSGYIQVRAFGTPTATAAPTLLNFNFSDVDNGTSISGTLNPDGSCEIIGAGGTNRVMSLQFQDKIDLVTDCLTLNSGSITGQFVNLDPTVVENTTTETTLIGSIPSSASTTINANTIKQGDTFSLTANGTIQNADAAQTLQIRVYVGSALVADTGPVGLNFVSAAQVCEIELDNLTFRTVGAATVASTYSGGQFVYRDDTGTMPWKPAGLALLNNTTVDTTINNTINITAQWGAANAANILTIDTLCMTKKY